MSITQRPHVLAIGPTTSREREALRADGFRLSHAPTLLDGYAQARQRLALREPPRPTLILLDLLAHEPRFPELLAPQLVAVLARQMMIGALQPAWMIGLAPDSIPELDAEAHIAGCQHIVTAPLSDSARAILRGCSTQPARLPHASLHGETIRAIQAYQRAAERVLTAVQAAQVPLWTAEDARLLLHALTRYPLRQSQASHPPHAAAQRFVRALGGPSAARQQLHVIAEAWQTRAPLHGEILWFFLDGWSRREIVSYYVSRGLYEDSRVYTAIQQIPERLAVAVQRAQPQEDA